MSERLSGEKIPSCGWSTIQDYHGGVNDIAFHTDRDSNIDSGLEFLTLDFRSIRKTRGKELNMHCIWLTSPLEDVRLLHGFHVVKIPPALPKIATEKRKKYLFFGTLGDFWITEEHF